MLGFENYDDLKDAHYKWVNIAMQTDNRGKENKWTQSIAVGSKTFIEKMKGALGFRAKGRKMWAAVEADTQFTTFDLSALKKQCLIFFKEKTKENYFEINCHRDLNFAS